MSKIIFFFFDIESALISELNLTYFVSLFANPTKFVPAVVFLLSNQWLEIWENLAWPTTPTSLMCYVKVLVDQSFCILGKARKVDVVRMRILGLHYHAFTGFHMTSLKFKLKKLDPFEVLFSWCIRTVENYYSHKFSLQMVFWFCDRQHLNF